MPSGASAVVLIGWLAAIVFVWHVLSLRSVGFAAAGRSKWKWLGIAVLSFIPFVGIPAYLYFLIRVRRGVVQSDWDHIVEKRRRRATRRRARAAAAAQRARTPAQGSSSYDPGWTAQKSTCMSCSGTGKQTCYACGGSKGKMENGSWVPCTSCGASGRSQASCMSCGGSGKK